MKSSDLFFKRPAASERKPPTSNCRTYLLYESQRLSLRKKIKLKEISRKPTDQTYEINQAPLIHGNEIHTRQFAFQSLLENMQNSHVLIETK